MKKYKIHTRPCSPFEGYDGDGETIELETDDIDWSMKQYQRNRVPLIWEILDVTG